LGNERGNLCQRLLNDCGGDDKTCTSKVFSLVRCYANGPTP